MTKMQDLLVCPTCRARLSLDGEHRCARCGVRVKTFRGGLDFLPEGASSALEGKHRPSWSDWSDRLSALERWRAQRRGAPAQQRDLERLRRLVSFGALSGGALLDLGCGSASLRALLPEEISYVGVDPMPSEEIAASGFVVRGVAEYLPFADESFSAVTMLSVFDYFVDPERSLSEARRVLRPGGVLLMIITVRADEVARAFHAKGPLAPLVSLRPGVIRAIGVRGALTLALDQALPKRKAHVSYFSEPSLLSLVKRFFHVEESRYDQPSVLFLRLRRV